jgi:hypothetical protein
VTSLILAVGAPAGRKANGDKEFAELTDLAPVRRTRWLEGQFGNGATSP